jgi:formylmethanofuran dehydrogenase subunit A
VAPSGARQCRLELADTPNIDRGFLLLLANHELVLDLLARGEREAALDVVASLLSRTGAYGIKAVNPGGVALWKSEAGRVEGIDQPLGSRGVTPRSILELLADAAEELRLPHAIHVHANRLGVPGNIETTLETSRALAGRRHHLTHAQFHAYGGDPSSGYTSAAARLAEHFHRHPELTLDVGQVLFEEALTLSADLALEHTLWQLTGKRYATVDVELETGCGMVPFQYLPRSRLHALQWAVGMELFLLCKDPWRIALTTDHPNGGSFLTYPKIIALLMSRDLRAEAIRSANAAAIASTSLPEIDREYSLGEIAIVTRAAPARILGLTRKGHLGAGADADVTIYDDQPDRERMFRSPRYVLKAGEVVVEKGEIRAPAAGETFRSPVAPVASRDKPLREWFSRHGSYRLEQMGPDPREPASIQGAKG